ncbi:MAG: glycogen synthase GlgA [Deltaproteobacteria bacterium]|nr:glycogen synthase GlgA [Deltaproteobacteria bacterium]
MDPLKILFVSPEVVPFAKTGGLADVAGSLPKALKGLGCDVRLTMPLYQAVRQGKFLLRKVLENLPIPLGGSAIASDIYEGELAEGLPVYFIERDEFYDRLNLYGSAKGDYFDNDRRFSFFARGTLNAVQALGFQPDIIHCHDWQTGLIPACLHFGRNPDSFFRRTAGLFTIHNMAYQGSFPRTILELAGLPETCFSPEGLEFWGRANLLKAGIVYSQIINTVSRKYSQEIQTEEFGYGLEGILAYRKADLFGILNGVDYDLWNPETDFYLAAHYSSPDLSGKKICKKDLLNRLGLPEDRFLFPVLGIISRLADQKGFDLLAGIMDPLLSQEVSLVVLGTGEEKYHRLLAELAEKYPKKLAVRLTFDNALAHQIEAGSDLFLMPSRYEPCGLNQIYSLKYGTIPVVRATGGLDDTIIPFDPQTGRGTGFKFYPYQPEALWSALEEALEVYRDQTRWVRLMKNAMAMDFSWEASAREYIKLYLLAKERLKGF